MFCLALLDQIDSVRMTDAARSSLLRLSFLPGSGIFFPPTCHEFIYWRNKQPEAKTRIWDQPKLPSLHGKKIGKKEKKPVKWDQSEAAANFGWHLRSHQVRRNWFLFDYFQKLDIKYINNSKAMKSQGGTQRGTQKMEIDHLSQWKCHGRRNHGTGQPWPPATRSRASYLMSSLPRGMMTSPRSLGQFDQLLRESPQWPGSNHFTDVSKHLQTLFLGAVAPPIYPERLFK